MAGGEAWMDDDFVTGKMDALGIIDYNYAAQFGLIRDLYHKISQLCV